MTEQIEPKPEALTSQPVSAPFRVHWDNHAHHYACAGAGLAFGAALGPAGIPLVAIAAVLTAATRTCYKFTNFSFAIAALLVTATAATDYCGKKLDEANDALLWKSIRQNNWGDLLGELKRGKTESFAIAEIPQYRLWNNNLQNLFSLTEREVDIVTFTKTSSRPNGCFDYSIEVSGMRYRQYLHRYYAGPDAYYCPPPKTPMTYTYVLPYGFSAPAAGTDPAGPR